MSRNHLGEIQLEEMSKAMSNIMSNKEEIVRTIVEENAAHADRDFLKEYVYLFKKAMQAHTNQPLQELKEKVEKWYNDSEKSFREN